MPPARALSIFSTRFLADIGELSRERSPGVMVSRISRKMETCSGLSAIHSTAVIRAYLQVLS